MSREDIVSRAEAHDKSEVIVVETTQSYEAIKPQPMQSEIQLAAIVALFQEKTAKPEVVQRFEGSNFVINFSTKGQPISRYKNDSRAEMKLRRPPDPEDMVVEVLRQARVIEVNPVIKKDDRPQVKAYLTSLKPEFKSLPEKKHTENFQKISKSAGIQYFDSLSEAVNDHWGSVYDANLEIGKRFMAFLGTQLLDSVVALVEDISPDPEPKDLPAAS